jgi:GxxExxY protein
LEKGRVEERTEAAARQLVDSAMKVHRALGPGLLESASEHCLEHELGLRGVACRRQAAIPINYEGLQLEVGYRLDLLVDERVIVEIKSVDALTSIHQAQLLTYLRFSGYRLGFLLNFNTTLLKNGLKRMAL